jgi:TolB-like protein/AraC-like DNA-binding protein/Tfp pilus assembly protein PilF
MSDIPLIENDFLAQLTALVEKHIANEDFGVSELADEMHMSRSNLLRKVKKETKLSVSQFINQVRLKRAMEMLRKSALNVSEVSHQVGFNSTSYFIKCFREFYGYPPGEVGKRDATEVDNIIPSPHKDHRRRNLLLLSSFVLVVIVGVFSYFLWWPMLRSSSSLERSIAVLPFKNDSNDSTNVYLINGLMESTLNNLQQIKDLKVISRTSAEKYRNTSKTIPEMAKELNVNYFVEGSGQKIGDQILLNIQLIEASTDKHLWARQYRREVKDIFELQREIAKNIAEEIQAVITPEEEQRIEKKPTDNLQAYDLYLKGMDLKARGGTENLNGAISNFKKAIELDPDFALAYANAVVTYYYLDVFHKEKKYGPEINSYADKALLIDPTLGESLIAKAVSYLHKKEFQQAVPYLEKALEYNPNSALVIGFLTDFYHDYLPNTTKYLEYSLKGIRLDIASQDSVSASYTFLRLSNALVQVGFADEAVKYIDKSLAYNPKNPYGEYLKAFILLAGDRDLQRTKVLLEKILTKDSTRIDVIQDAGKICYLMRDYACAYRYYNKLIQARKIHKLEIYNYENLRIAVVMEKMGFRDQSKELMKSYKAFADNDKSIYKHLGLASYYSWLGDKKKSIEHFKLFSKESDYLYWVLLWYMDTSLDNVKDDPEFKKVIGEIETKFWNNNKKMRTRLEEEGLLQEEFR